MIYLNSLYKYLLMSYDVLGTVLGDEETLGDKIRSWHSWSIHSGQRVIIKKINTRYMVISIMKKNNAV